MTSRSINLASGTLEPYATRAWSACHARGQGKVNHLFGNTTHVDGVNRPHSNDGDLLRVTVSPIAGGEVDIQSEKESKS